MVGDSVVDNRLGSRFELQIDGEVAGYLVYQRDGNSVSFLEVTTDPRRAGQGLGLVLVRQALNAVSAEGLSVLPVCPFVRDFIRRHPVYLDVVPADLRERFELPPG
jgi:predicted GNAT family acetyltransferase